MAFDSATNTITCDKCGHQETGDNKQFFESGWILNMSARKYKNRCRKCLTKKEQATQDWVRARFKPTNF